jgi:hypothetical protein
MRPKELFLKEYFNLRELALYSGLGIRFLRDALKDPEHSLPHFRINKKTIIVSRTDFIEWLETYKADATNSIDQIVDQVILDIHEKTSSPLNYKKKTRTGASC